MKTKYWKEMIGLGILVGLLTGVIMVTMGNFVRTFFILILAFIDSNLVRQGVTLQKLSKKGVKDTKNLGKSK